MSEDAPVWTPPSSAHDPAVRSVAESLARAPYGERGVPASELRFWQLSPRERVPYWRQAEFVVEQLRAARLLPVVGPDSTRGSS